MSSSNRTCMSLPSPVFQIRSPTPWVWLVIRETSAAAAKNMPTQKSDVDVVLKLLAGTVWFSTDQQDEVWDFLYVHCFVIFLFGSSETETDWFVLFLFLFGWLTKKWNRLVCFRLDGWQALNLSHGCESASLAEIRRAGSRMSNFLIRSLTPIDKFAHAAYLHNARCIS